MDDDVKRYFLAPNWPLSPYMAEHPEGAYVTYEDFRKRFDREVLEAAGNPFKAALKPVYRRQEFEKWFDEWKDPNVGHIENLVEKNAAWAAWKAAIGISRCKSWGGYALDGWKLVPAHPTKEMREAGAKINNQGWDFAHHTWNTMFLHAPNPEDMGK